MILSIIAVVVLLAANAFFVAAEFALVKVRDDPAGGAGRGRQRAGRAGRSTSSSISRPISPPASSASPWRPWGWAGSASRRSRPCSSPLFRLAGLSDAALHTVSFLVGFLIFSSLHIVIGEQVPKTFAIRQPEPISFWVAVPLHAFFLLCWPLNWALNTASRGILRLLGVAEAGHIDAYSGAELRQLIGASRQLGAMKKQEHDMLGAILDLEKVEVGEVMTHRRNIVSINADAPVEEIVRQVLEGPYTRYPIWRGDPDTIIGVLHAKDVLAAIQRHGAKVTSADLRRLATPPWFIPDTTSLLHQLLASASAARTSPSSSTSTGRCMGLVTLEDILEEIVGDIVDEKDVEISGVKQEADGSILVEGRVTIRDLNRQFDWHLPDEEATTVAGLLLLRGAPHPRDRRELPLPRLPLRGGPPPAPPADAAAAAARGRTPLRRPQLPGDPEGP